MKRFLGLIVLVFIGTAGWRVGNSLSSDAISMAVGVLFGVLAGIPAALLLLAAERRRPARPTREYGHDYSRTQSLPHGDGRYLPPQPPVIVVTGAPGATAHPYVGLPGFSQPAHHPMPWEVQRPARQYKVVGEQEEWVQEW